MGESKNTVYLKTSNLVKIKLINIQYFNYLWHTVLHYLQHDFTT